MKTTIEISDPLLKAAKARAKAENTTLRELIEVGLRRVLEESKPARRFKLRDASVDGSGLCPEVREGTWETIRELIYSGHGS